MNIACQACHADFQIRVDPENKKEIHSHCPFCKARVVLEAPDSSGNRRVLFPSEEIKERECIECGRVFSSTAQDPVPICSQCKGEGEPVLHSNSEKNSPASRRAHSPLSSEGVWRFVFQGKETELESEATVRQWIMNGMIRPSDTLTAPNGRSSPASAYPQFSDSFRQRSLKEKAHVELMGKGYRSWRSRAKVVFFILSILALLPLSFGLYRALTYAPPVHLVHPKYELYLEDLKRTRQPFYGAVDTNLSKALASLSLHRMDETLKAKRILEETLLGDQSRGDVLGLIAEINSYFSNLGDRSSLRLATLDFANMAIELFPKSSAGYVAKARAALGAEDYKVARQAAEEAVRMNPDNARAHLILSKVLLASATSRAEIDDAHRSVLTSIRLDPLLLESHSTLGEIHIARNEPHIARSIFEKRLSLAPDDGVSLYYLGHLEDRAGNFDRASEWYQAALRAERSLSKARNRLALIYQFHQDKPAWAQRHWMDILYRYENVSDSSTLASALSHRADFLRRSGKPKEAQELLDSKTIVFAKPKELELVKALTHIALGNLSKAQEILRQDAQSEKLDIENALLLSSTLYTSTNPDETLRMLREVSNEHPDDLRPYLLSIHYSVGSGRNEDALTFINTALARTARSDEAMLWTDQFRLRFDVPWTDISDSLNKLKALKENAQVLTLDGLFHLLRYEMTKNQDALRSAEKSLSNARSLSPKDTNANLNLAKARFFLGNTRGADAILKELIALDPFLLKAQYWKARTSLALSRIDEASIVLNRLESEPIFAALALDLRGQVHALQGKSDEARQNWEDALKLKPYFIDSWKHLLELSSQD